MLVTPLVHEVADALVHSDAGGGNHGGDGAHNSVVTRRNHQRTLTEDADELENVVVLRSEDGNGSVTKVGRKFNAGARVKPLHGHQNRENFVALEECPRGSGKCGNVTRVFRIDGRAGFMKVNGPILAVFVSAGGCQGEVFRERSLDRPHKGKNRTKRENGGRLLSAGVAKPFSALYGKMLI